MADKKRVLSPAVMYGAAGRETRLSGDAIKWRYLLKPCLFSSEERGEIPASLLSDSVQPANKPRHLSKMPVRTSFSFCEAILQPICLISRKHTDSLQLCRDVS